APWPVRIYLPWTEVPWQQVRPGPYHGYAVLWYRQGGSDRLAFLRPDGSLADAAAVAVELGLPVAFEPPVPGEPTTASDCWAEEGSIKICWKIDGAKGCVKFG